MKNKLKLTHRNSAHLKSESIYQKVTEGFCEGVSGRMNCSKGTSGGVTVSKLDEQTYTSEFESHWVPHSFGLCHIKAKALCKLLKVVWL